MPFINIATSVKVEDKNKILNEITILISSLTNKSKRFVMAKLEDDSNMYFEDQSPCCFVEIKSIGSLDPSKMTRPICDFIYNNMGITSEKIYIYFEDVGANMWSWDGKTFG